MQKTFKIIQLKSLPILRLVGGIVVIDGGLLLDDFTLGAWAGHGRAEEDVDEEHDAEQDGEGDAKPHQPIGIAGAPSDPGAINSSGCNVNMIVDIYCKHLL